MIVIYAQNTSYFMVSVRSAGIKIYIKMLILIITNIMAPVFLFK